MPTPEKPLWKRFEEEQARKAGKVPEEEYGSVTSISWFVAFACRGFCKCSPAEFMFLWDPIFLMESWDSRH